MNKFNLYPGEGLSALTQDEVKAAVADAVAEYKGTGKRILLIIPDYTRYTPTPDSSLTPFTTPLRAARWSFCRRWAPMCP